jgi:ERCC4-type nuclease
MVQLSIVVRPKSGYSKANASRKITVDSSQRLEQILTDLKLPKKGAVLYSHGKELPLNSSLASHNIQDGDVLESCASPNLSAILSAVLQDLNAVEKVPEEERTEERIKPLLDNADVVPWSDRWSFDDIKHRKICLATIKKALQRDDRFSDLLVPVCGDLTELHQFMETHVWSDSLHNNNGTPRRRFNSSANLFKPSAKNSNGQPTTCWQLLQKKLEKFLLVATTLLPNADIIEEFVKAENLRHNQPETATRTPRSTPRRTNSRGDTSTLARTRRIHSSAPSPSVGQLVCTSCQERPADSLCLEGSCPFFQQASCTMCFHGNHPMHIRNHERVPWDDARARAVTRAQNKAPYCPQFESGPYAVLATLFERSQYIQRREYSLAEDRLKKLAQARCRANMYDHQARGRSAFACIEALAEKKLVRKEIVPGRQQHNGKFSLLPDGEALANFCLLFEQASKEVFQSKDMERLRTSALAGSNRNVSLIVDTREDSNYAARLLERCHDAGISGEARELPAGDYLFTTRRESDGEELVLPLVIERKSWSDLADSVSDQGKGHRRLDCVKVDGEGPCQRPCQLCRMKTSGCTKVMFIIEGARCLNRDDDLKCSDAKRCQYCRELSERHGSRLMQEQLENVLYQLQAKHKCLILFTRGYNETIDSLLMMHKLMSECGNLVSDPTPMMKPKITYHEFCTNARRRNRNEPLGDPRRNKNGSVVVWNSDEFVNCVHQGNLQECLSSAFPACFDSSTRNLKNDFTSAAASIPPIQEKHNVPNGAAIDLLSSDSEDDDIRNSQDSVSVLHGVGLTNPNAGKSNAAGESDVIVLDDAATSRTKIAPKLSTASQVADNGQRDTHPSLLILSGMSEYDTDFYKDIDKVWRSAVLMHTDTRQSEGRSNGGQHDSRFLESAKGRLQELALGQLPLVNRRSILFWILWIQLRTNVMVHFSRQSSCKDALTEHWQERIQKASRTPQSSQGSEAVSQEIDLTTMGATRAGSGTPNSAPRRQRRGPLSREIDLTTNVPTCAICMLSLINGEVEATPCAHSFHRQCLRSWFDQSRSRKCPTCNCDGLGAAKDDQAPLTPSAFNTNGSTRKRRRTPVEPCQAQSNESQTDMAVREARLRRFGCGGVSEPTRTESSSVNTTTSRTSGWDCPKCTFVNEDPLSACCHMCGAASPKKAPPRAGISPSIRPPNTPSRRELFPKRQCKMCTLENDYSNLRCEACNSEFDEGTLPSPSTVTTPVTKPNGRPPRPPPRTNDPPLANENKPKSKVKCGACGLEGHNRGSATEDTCAAYFKPEEIELRQKKKEKAETQAREARHEADRIRRRTAESEAAQQTRMAEMQRLLADAQRDSEETQRIRREEVQRQEKAAQRAAKRARRLG